MTNLASAGVHGIISIATVNGSRVLFFVPRIRIARTPRNLYTVNRASDTGKRPPLAVAARKYLRLFNHINQATNKKRTGDEPGALGQQHNVSRRYAMTEDILADDVKVVKQINGVMFINGNSPSDEMGLYFDHETLDAYVETIRQFKATHTPADIEHHNREMLKRYGQLAPENGTVYLMKDEAGRHKIGMVSGRHVEDRRKAIARELKRQVWTIHSFFAFDRWEAEAKLHQRHWAVRDVGEWFWLEPDHIAEICAIVEYDYGDFIVSNGAKP